MTGAVEIRKRVTVVGGAQCLDAGQEGTSESIGQSLNRQSSWEGLFKMHM